MLKLNYKSGVPICDQIVNGFVRMKALGLVESGEQLPSVRALAMELGVNPNTIQKAYQILETNGIIYSVKREAVSAAAELGLRKPELIEIVSEMFEKEGDAK